jgi:hypothetical protein
MIASKTLICNTRPSEQGQSPLAICPIFFCKIGLAALVPPATFKIGMKAMQLIVFPID